MDTACPMKTTMRVLLLTTSVTASEASTVAATSATGFDSSNGKRRASAHRPMPALFFRLHQAHACTQRSSLYGGRRRGAFGLAGFLFPRSVNPASSVTLFDSGVTGITRRRNCPMPARSRAARVYLRARRFSRQRQMAAAFQELRACHLALATATAVIAAGMHSGVVSANGAYELLGSVADRLERAVDQVEQAMRGQGGAA